MQITYGGVPLLLQDPEGATDAFLAKYLPEMYASIFCHVNTAVSDARYLSEKNLNSDVSTIRRVGLPVGNYPPMPAPRINSLYWPTGAKRWAHGLFLIDGATLAMIVSNVANNAGANLVIADDQPQWGPAANSSVSSTMYLLPPRPVSPPGVVSDARLWLLPLVDIRFFWQQAYVQAYAPGDWLSAVSDIDSTGGAYLGGGGADFCSMSVPPSSYGTPYGPEWQRDFEQAALLLDAIALTLQRRVVGAPAIDYAAFAEYAIQSSSEAAVVCASNLALNYPVVAGGDFSQLAFSTLGNGPKTIYVTFTDPDGSQVGGYASSDASNPTNRAVKVFHCADSAGVTGASSPVTSGPGADLANQIATDYFGWFSYSYDITYAGIVPWVPTGFDDYVLWEFAAKRYGKRRGFVCQTRVVSMPPNFGADQLPLALPGSSSSSGSSGSSASSSSDSNCVTVVTNVQCTGGNLVVTYGSARKC